MPVLTKKADYWIINLNLESHPEGGYFRETYRASEDIPADALPEGFSSERSFCTAIYFLLKSGQVSRFHRIKSDEQWHFYTGSSLTLHIIDKNGKYSQKLLGPDLENGEVFQLIVPAGCWFGATVNNPDSYSLAGCVVSPGFHFDDFELAEREQLLEEYPEHKEIIERLTK